MDKSEYINITTLWTLVFWYSSEKLRVEKWKRGQQIYRSGHGAPFAHLFVAPLPKSKNDI